MKLLDFISLEFDNSDLTDEDDINRLINGDMPKEQQVPTIEIPVTLDAADISRIFPSIYGNELTDVFLKDGDILTAKMPRTTFKIKWLEARGEILDEAAFKDFSYLDENLKIRVHNN
jgi:hypothetical protein